MADLLEMEGTSSEAYGRHFAMDQGMNFFFFIPYFYKQGINWKWSEMTGSLVTSFISFMPLGMLAKSLHLNLPIYTVKT